MTPTSRLQSVQKVKRYNFYGLTETIGGIVFTPPVMKCGNVGSPLPGVEIKLFDIPEMNYPTTNSQGEIGIRGKLVARGYYKNEEATANAFTGDGWFLTGDVGQWNADDVFSIIDRKKEEVQGRDSEAIAVHPEGLRV